MTVDGLRKNLGKRLERRLHRLGSGAVSRVGLGILYRATKPAFVRALQDAPIRRAGVSEDGVPFAVCEDGTQLFGARPSADERRLYHALRRRLPEVISEPTFRVAIDVVLRYQYPHALVGETMPFSAAERAIFHRQHRDTIDDIPNLSAGERARLKALFTPERGETVLDLGAYQGYGALRLCRYVGKEGRVVSVEANPENYAMLRRNVEANVDRNVTPVLRAVWSERRMMPIAAAGRQVNSLVDGIVRDAKARYVEVQADTAAAILAELGIDEVGLVSLTLNGAEVEAVESLKDVLRASRKPRVTLAGWYVRDKKEIHELTEPALRAAGLTTLLLPHGRLLAWREDSGRRV